MITPALQLVTSSKSPKRPDSPKIGVDLRETLLASYQGARIFGEWVRELKTKNTLLTRTDSPSRRTYYAGTSNPTRILKLKYRDADI
jgi:hypothetical protein